MRGYRDLGYDAVKMKIGGAPMGDDLVGLEAVIDVVDDHEAHRVSEIDVINGEVVRQAEHVGVRVPVNTTLIALVQAVEREWIQ